MQFQVINDRYYENLLHNLTTIVPEFISVFDSDDGGYLILGEFRRFLVKNMTHSKIFSNCCNFLNEAIEKGGYKTKDAISCQIFSLIHKDEILVNRIKPNLKGSSLKLFLDYVNKLNE
tara:strand:- start:39056 stop:39409 length:354 start_codon:yes stop_codon:yes gene_type:complete